jgi:hypothetical protein
MTKCYGLTGKILGWMGSHVGTASVLDKILDIPAEKDHFIELIDNLVSTGSEPDSVRVCYKELNNKSITKTIISLKEWIGTSKLPLDEWLEIEKSIY